MASDSPVPPSTRVDAFRARIDDGRIAVEMGRMHPAGDARDQAVVALSHCIALDHGAAMRLLSALQALLQQRGSRWAEAPGPQAAPASRAPTPSHAEPDEGGRRAARLIELVEGLGCPYYHERSFRISHGALAANRFLLTFNTGSFSGDLGPAVLGVCRQIGMPAEMQREVEQHVRQTRAVHFGFEGDDRIVYKVYLERAGAGTEGKQAAPGTPVLLHLACKWDSDDPAHRAISRYHWYPNLTTAQIGERMAGLYGGDPGHPSLRISREVLDMASGAMDPADLQYLEVREDGNARASYDLNIYNAGLQVKDAQPQLARMRDHFGIRPGQFQALYDQIKGRVLGHLAGGTHRNGRDFFNVYHGVQRRKG